MTGGHLFLIGFRGAGKTTVGRRCARRLGLPFVDLDRLVVDLAGCSVQALFRERGEVAFRRLETAALRSLAGAPPHVVATGGGVVERAVNRRLLRRLGACIWLQVAEPVLRQRLVRSRGRPSLTGQSISAEVGILLRRRRPLYRDAADAIVRCGAADPATCADRVVRRAARLLGARLLSGGAPRGGTRAVPRQS